MYINGVISFKGAWEFVTGNNGAELQDALDIIGGILSLPVDGELRVGYRELWEREFHKRKWIDIDRGNYEVGGRRVNFRRMGSSKNGVCVSFPLGMMDGLSRWIFQQGALAVRLGLVKVPILLVPMRSFGRTLEHPLFRRDSFEANLSQLEMLSPLSHQYPFLIVGYSNEKSIDGPEVTEILPDVLLEQVNSVIDRSIVFTSEYHQAGLDILSYFGTYLREQYPQESASVKIEQQGLTVRMIIETESGRSEIVEKALHEYELIVTRAAPPEKFATNDKLILELKNELRIAQFRLESQQDIMGLQNARFDKLLDMVGIGLSNKNTVMIDFKPDISLVSTVQVNCDIASALGGLNELLEGIPSASPAHLAFKELEGSLVSVEKCNDPDIVRKSPAMSKFRRVIESALQKGTEINTALDKVESGWEIFKDVAGKYNKIAEWCGLPQVPSAFTN